jgi:hypothetical protein
MSSAPVSTRRYQDSDSRLLNLMAGRSGLLASWLRLSLAAILNGRIMQHDCNLLYQLCFAKSKVLLQKCSIITSHLAILFFARGFAPRTTFAKGFSASLRLTSGQLTFPKRRIFGNISNRDQRNGAMMCQLTDARR